MFQRLLAALGIKSTQNADTKDRGLFNLATGDRNTISQTKSSDQLAREMLEGAQAKFASSPSGSEVTVMAGPGNQHVHHMELMFSIMMLAPAYGFTAGASLDNTFTLIKQ